MIQSIIDHVPKLSVVALWLLLPLISFAAASSDQIISRLIENILQPFVYLLFAVAFLVFFWGIFQMIKGADDENALKVGKQHLLWGLIGLLIMFGAEGILLIIKNTFGL